MNFPKKCPVAFQWPEKRTGPAAMRWPVFVSSPMVFRGLVMPFLAGTVQNYSWPLEGNRAVYRKIHMEILIQKCES